jgi:hypothetical protein
MDNPKRIKDFNQMLDRLVGGEDLPADGQIDPAMEDIARTLASADLSQLSRQREALRHRLARQGAAERATPANHTLQKRIPLFAAFSMGFATVLVIVFIGLAVILPLVRHATQGPSLAGQETLLFPTYDIMTKLIGGQLTETPNPSPSLPPSETAAAALPVTSPPPTVAPPLPTVTEVPPSATATVEPCSYEWFTAAPPPGACPTGFATASKAAYQSFEHGAMIWREGKGYIILPFNPSTGQQQGVISFAQDPLTIYRDTTASYSPPSGLYAPVSGFGVLWRGDYLAQEGQTLLDILGWGLAPEAGYMATEQTGTLSVKTDDTTQVTVYTYLTLPDGRLLELSRLADSSQPTSMRLLAGP